MYSEGYSYYQIHEHGLRGLFDLGCCTILLRLLPRRTSQIQAQPTNVSYQTTICRALATCLQPKICKGDVTETNGFQEDDHYNQQVTLRDGKSWLRELLIAQPLRDTQRIDP